MNSLNRIDFLKLVGAGAIAALCDSRSLIAAPPPQVGDVPVNIVIPESYRPRTDDAFAGSLKRAVLDMLQTHYSTQNMPVWRKPFHQIDLEVRVHWIIQWMMAALRQHQRVYPVDPVLILAMIMKESYFYEYAVSVSLAVGICQFVQPTAQEYQMLCAGTLPEHGRPPYRMVDYASKNAEYYQIRRDRREFYRTSRPKRRFDFNEMLAIIANNESDRYARDARIYKDYIERLDEFDRRRSEARDQFRDYLTANVAHRNLFDRNDLNFILGFDERFTYKKPLSGMVLMMARHLRARNGNVLPAVVGYNAGLSTTQDIGRFEPYGKIPHIEQSTEYISHVLVNHHEISRRL